MDAPSITPTAAETLEERHPLDNSASIAELIEKLRGFVSRQFPIFIFITGCALALGLLYLVTTPARYTAHAMLMIDSSKLRILQQQAPIGDIPIDTAQVETQVELLKSENVGLSVVKDLHLTEDPEFVGSGAGFIGAFFSLISTLFGSTEPSSEFALTRKALKQLIAARSIARVGRTYVLDIAFTSLNGGRAAQIANAIADAYIVDQLDAKYQATRRAGAWLQDRIKELRGQALAADRSVLEYKEKNGIVDIQGIGASGTGTRLLGDQQVTEISTQLSNARAATAEAQARLERIQDVLKREIPDAAVADSLHSEVINRLRNNYLDLAQREAIWSVRYGANHLATVNLRTQMAELRRSLTDELGRIAQSYKSDFEIAKSRQEGLEKQLAELVSGEQITNRDRLGLRELESTAQSYHTIYDNFLQRYMEAIQQESFPITEARVISVATPPLHKSGPITAFVLTIAGSLGLILSFGAATVREAIDRVFRSGRQVEEILGINCLAVLPSMAEVKIAMLSQDQDPLAMPPSRGAAATLDSQLKGKLLRRVVEEPLSAFAEAFRSVKVAADINKSLKGQNVIGVTSTVPREGKSTVSSNFAELIAHAGARVILVDGDLRNPTLTRAMAPDAKIGLLEVLGGKVSWRNAAILDEETQLKMLPAVLETRLVHTNEILASDAFKRLIDELRHEHDYVVIDLPPLAPVVDVRATTNVVDTYLFVIEWGRTHMNIVQHQLASAPEVNDRLLGAVLNKANVGVLARYEYYYGRYYYKRYYGRYGYGYRS
jgi:succinoglycan biosynthesis transport protein ExoP